MSSHPSLNARESGLGLVVLAGGAGRRMWPFAEVRNKVALPVCNRPLLAWTLEAARETGRIAEVVVVTGRHPGSVRDAVALADGVPIRFVAAGDGPGEGTATAAWVGLRALGDSVGGALVLMGDCWFDAEDLGRLCAVGAGLDGPAVLVSELIAPQDDPRMSVGISVDGEGRVTRLLMQPRESLGRRWAGAMTIPRCDFAGLAAVPEAVDQIEVGAMPPLGAELGQWLGMRIGSGGTVRAVEAEGLRCDLDRPWDLLWLNERVAERLVGGMGAVEMGAGALVDGTALVEGPIRLGRGSRLGRGVIVRGGLWAGDDVEITDGAVIDGPVVVGDGTRIARYCQVGSGTVIGKDCRILHGAEVQGLFLNRFYAYHYCEFWGVCGTAVDLGAATVCGNLRFDDGETEHRVGSRREVPRHAANAAYLGDYCRTGVNAILLPGMKCGVYSVIGPGTIVSGDIADRSRVFVEQRVIRKEWGPDRYAW